MSASALRSTELSIEILEKILLHLPGGDIIKMEVVQCVIHPARFSIDFHPHGLDQLTTPGSESYFTSTSASTRSLLSGLQVIEGPCNPRDFAQRRKPREEYGHK